MMFVKHAATHFRSHKRIFSSRTKIRNIVLLVKDTKASASFYQNALGVTIIGQSEKMAQLDAGGTPIILKVKWDSMAADGLLQESATSPSIPSKLSCLLLTIMNSWLFFMHVSINILANKYQSWPSCLLYEVLEVFKKTLYLRWNP